MLLRNLLVILGLILTSVKTHASYTPGIGINVGTMGKDLTIGLTVHNFIQNKWLLNLYGSWDYRFWGYQSWKHTGSAGIGFGATLWGQLNKNMLGLSLGIDHTKITGPGMYGKIHYSLLFGK